MAIIVKFFSSLLSSSPGVPKKKKYKNKIRTRSLSSNLSFRQKISSFFDPDLYPANEHSRYYFFKRRQMWCIPATEGNRDKLKGMEINKAMLTRGNRLSGFLFSSLMQTQRKKQRFYRFPEFFHFSHCSFIKQ